jgi:HTH-type transcriptional regulator/antitoxin HigA
MTRNEQPQHMTLALSTWEREQKMGTATEYRKLLAAFVPRPIRSEKDYRRALAQLGKLMVPHPGSARSRLIEVLSTLIEKYESREYPTPHVSPSKMLAHLLEAKSLKCADLAKSTGIPAATLSNVLANRRGISKDNGIKLAKYFGVSPVVFLVEPERSDKTDKQSTPAAHSRKH